MLETLYSSGLRVSELVNLLRSQIHKEEGFLNIIGKGNKERLVPIGGEALKHIELYEKEIRNKINIKPGHESVFFSTVMDVNSAGKWSL